MPIRAFVGQSLEELKCTLVLLDKALLSGSLEELRVAGITTRTGPMKQLDLQLRYQQCRYEQHLRIKSLPCTNPQRPALLIEFPDPYREVVRRVESLQVRRGLVFPPLV